MSLEQVNDRFGVMTWAVSGYATAQDSGTALAFGRGFKMTGGVITRSEKETASNEYIQGHDSTGGTLFGRIDFSYQYAASSGQVSVTYGIDHEYDYTKLEKSVAIQGTAYGPSGPLCREAIAANSFERREI